MWGVATTGIPGQRVSTPSGQGPDKECEVLMLLFPYQSPDLSGRKLAQVILVSALTSGWPHQWDINSEKHKTNLNCDSW